MFANAFPFPNDVYTPSMTIFAESPGPILGWEGAGYWLDVKGIALPSTYPGINIYAAASTGISYSSTRNTAWKCVTANGGSASQIALYTRPFIRLDNYASEVYLETSVAFSSTGADTATQGYFFGIATRVEAEGSSTLQSDASTLNASTSVIGFWLHGGTSSTLDAIYMKGVPATTGTVSTVASNVRGIAPGITDPLGNVKVTAPGVLVSNAYTKLGLKIKNGAVTFYVDGYAIATKQMDSTFNRSSTAYSVIQSVYSGASTAVLAVHNEFLRVAVRV